jgi:hypothetical protein
MKWVFLILSGILILTACGQADPISTTPQSAEKPIAEKGATATLQPPTEPALTIEVDPTITPEQAPPTITAVPSRTEPTDPPPTTTGPVEPTRIEEVTFNGVYEDSYFRGSADAPVTLTDYSDFL